MQIAQSNGPNGVGTSSPLCGPNRVGTSSPFCLRTETDAVSDKLFTFFRTEMLDEVQKLTSPKCNISSSEPCRTGGFFWPL